MKCTQEELRCLNRKAPTGLYESAKDQGEFSEYIIFKKESAWNIQEKMPDYTPHGWNGWIAKCHCTVCDENFITGYRKGKQIVMYSLYGDRENTVKSGESDLCPYCEAQIEWKHISDICKTEDAQITSCEYAGDRLWFRKWLIRKTLNAEYTVRIFPMEAVATDGKTFTRYSKGYYYYGGFYERTEWMRLARLDDCIGAPYIAGSMPKLTDTNLENCRLADYYEQSYQSGYFVPVAWLRLWAKRNNAEVLMDAGLGNAIGMYIKVQKLGKLSAGVFNWKKKKPHEILGITKEELRQAVTLEKDALLLIEARNGVKIADICTMDRLGVRRDEIKEICAKYPMRAVKLARYLKGKSISLSYYNDYLEMLQEVEGQIEPSMLYPADPIRLHNEMANRRNLLDDRENSAKMEKMADLMEKIWYREGDICIRPARSDEELVKEGAVLHHCVGGYGKKHTRGQVILFVRHARRPERSWYTLNIDLRTKKEIQLHGYGNEYAHGKRLKIPQEVRSFVDKWKSTVLMSWVIPQELKNMIEF